MVRYDPRVISEYAVQLYSRAARTVFLHTAAGVIVGGLAGFLAGESLGGGLGAAAALALAAFFGFIMYSIGQDKAAALRLAAQTALCQVQIEANTRRGARSHQPHAAARQDDGVSDSADIVAEAVEMKRPNCGEEYRPGFTTCADCGIALIPKP